MMRLRSVRRAMLLVPALLFAGCSTAGRMSTLEPEGPIAREIFSLSKLPFLLACAVLVLVEGMLVFALFRFRERRGGAAPKQTHGNTRLEIGWTVLPSLMLAVVAVPTVSTIISMSRAPASPLNVTVVGHQWWWDYEYEDSKVRTANELHIPTDRPVYLKMTSADVIHAFWVPKLAGKQDVVPGRDNFLTIRADEPGEYYGQCAEFCALSHANMRLRVIAQSPADFEAWVADQQAMAPPASSDVAMGERLFLSGKCVQCHAVDGTAAARPAIDSAQGPDLTHFASRGTFGGATFVRNDENLVRWLRDPPKMKPGSKMPDYDLTEDEISNLVAYLQSLT